MLEFSVGQMVSNGKSFGISRERKAQRWRANFGPLYCLLRRNLPHGIGVDPVDLAPQRIERKTNRPKIPVAILVVQAGDGSFLRLDVIRAVPHVDMLKITQTLFGNRHMNCLN